MLAREDSGTYRLTIDGRTVGRVERPLERPMLGRDKGTVYLARSPRIQGRNRERPTA